LKPFFEPREPCLDKIKAKRLLMRKGCFKVTHTNRHVVRPLLNAVNGRSHGREMFENQVYGVFGRADLYRFARDAP
jgi:hypothetical protein